MREGGRAAAVFQFDNEMLRDYLYPRDPRFWPALGGKEGERGERGEGEGGVLRYYRLLSLPVLSYSSLLVLLLSLLLLLLLSVLLLLSRPAHLPNLLGQTVSAL